MAKTKALSELADHLGYWLRAVSNGVSQAFARRVENSGVTVAEWVVLRELYGLAEAQPNGLAERLGLTRGAVSKLVERLVAKKLVVRTADCVDRRYQNLRLTDAGKKLMPVLAGMADANDEEFFSVLTGAEQRELRRMLEKLVAAHGWKSAPVE